MEKYTISTHNGSAVSIAHNRREPSTVSAETHINPRGHFELWKDIPIRDAYKQLFGAAQEAYNQKQARQDRKIKDYYNAIKNSPVKHTAYEMIIAVGSKTHRPSAELCRQILKDYADDWEVHNPNLFMCGAYYHADEQGVPHLHVDYIPVAHGYKRGMETQTGLVKALGEMGYTKGVETAQIQWQRAENMRLEHICKEYGLDIEHPQAGKSVEHKSVEEYKLTKQIEELKRATEALKRATDKVREAEQVLSGAMPSWIKKKGLINKSYVIEEEHAEDLERILATPAIKEAVEELKRANREVEASADLPTLEELHKNWLRQKEDLECKKRRIATLEKETGMHVKKIQQQAKEIEKLKTFIETKGLSKDLKAQKEKEWQQAFESFFAQKEEMCR